MSISKLNISHFNLNNNNDIFLEWESYSVYFEVHMTDTFFCLMESSRDRAMEIEKKN